MKKISLLLMLIGGMTLSAQVPVVPRDTNLFYYWWYEDLIADTAQRIFINSVENTHNGDSGLWSDQMLRFLDHPILCGEVAKYFYTDTPLTILGIRTCSDESYDFYFSGNPDTIWYEDVFLSVYKREGDSMLLLGRKHFYYDYQFYPYKNGMMDINIRRIYTDGSCELRLRNWGVPYREYYFDQPITVEDSFYIGVTLEPDSSGPRFEHRPFGNLLLLTYACISDKDLNDHCPHTSHNFPALKYRYRMMSFDEYDPEARYSSIWTKLEWRDTAIKSCLMVFPIVKYGSVFANCTPVEGLHTIKQEGATFYFEWSDSTMSHRGWEFTYVPEGSSPDGGTAVECSEANASATVEPGIQYRAFVRPRCVANRYGDWGTGVPFCYNCQPGATGDVEATVSVHPNPTSSVVEVVSPNNIQRIEVYDSRGTIVSTATGNGGNTRIDLSPYADGLYLIKILTPEGTATKQVMKTSNSDPKER